MNSCRFDIQGKIIWHDNDNAFNTRPESVTVSLLRDGILLKSYDVFTDGTNEYRFPCLLKRASDGHPYHYELVEDSAPDAYSKTMQKYNIIHTLEHFDIEGKKTWIDRNNAQGLRPSSITLTLYRNDAAFRSLVLSSPPDAEDFSTFTFDSVPFSSGSSVPYIYTVDENDIDNYTKEIYGFNITNFEIIP